MESIKTCLLKYIEEPNNPTYNFELAHSYEEEKQYAAAYSFYLRCAEFTHNNMLACESLIRASLCINKQQYRDSKELYLIKQALCVSPNSPEPYYIASLYFYYRSTNEPNRRWWLDSYMYASLGVNVLETTTVTNFIHSIDYSKINLYYQKALSATKIGKLGEAVEIYKKLLLFTNDSNLLNLFQNNITQLTVPLNSILNSISYKKYKKYTDNNTVVKSEKSIIEPHTNLSINYDKFIQNHYDFFPCHDQLGNDSYRVSITNINEALYNLYNTKSVVALNTFGYVKHTISKLEQIDGWNFDNKHGIYIKKPDTTVYSEVAQGALVVVGVLVCTTTKWIKKQLASIDYPIENYIIINNNAKCLAHELDIIVSKKHKFIKNMSVYHMPYNLGCAEGWNTIIKSFLFSPYWVILNDDVSFMPGFLEELHNSTENNKDAGFIHGKPCCLPYLYNFGSFDMFLIRDWVVKEYGLFDINYYPAYFEDFDYIMRLYNKPIKIINTLTHGYLHGDTTDYNISGSNTQKASDDLFIRMTNSRYKNLDYFVKKWNIYPEYITDENHSFIFKYPFNNVNNSLSFNSFDFEFRKSKYLDNELHKSTSNTKVNTKVNTKLNTIPLHHINIKTQPNLIVLDNFYENPDLLRDYALGLKYEPPENHGALGFRCESGRKLLDGTKELFEKLLHATIPDGANLGEWNYSTNGCFQWCNGSTQIVYHCDSQKYAGIVYLTPDAPINCGTSFLRHKKYKLRTSEIFSKNDWYDSLLNFNEPHLDKSPWEVVDSIGNIYNRLVIFDAQYIHAVTEYFGETINNSRLFQLFFFNLTN
jgi:GT2 family glycosyltransferase